jgi:hypothetical protein
VSTGSQYIKTTMGRLVISPDVFIRIVDGRVCFSGHSGEALGSYGVDILDWIGRCVLPVEEQEVLAEVGPEDRERVRQEMQSLIAAGVLVPPLACGPDDPTGDPGPVAEAREAKTCLAAIANAVHQISGDLAGFGPYATERIHDAGGPPLGSRLASTLVDLLSLQSDLRNWRKGYVAGQLHRLGIGPGSNGLKLNIGAGRYRLDSWVNIDVHPAELAMDIRWGLPGLPDGAVQWIVLIHMLEHLYFPGEADALMRELRRVLAPGGVVRIVVPDIEKCLRAYADGDSRFFDDRKNTWTRIKVGTKLEAFLNYAGAGPNPGQFLSSHKFGYDFETLEHLLRRAGFTSVARSGYMQSSHETLRVDDASRVGGAAFGEQYYSLFVEASV